MLWQKILTLLIIASGETLMITAQIFGARVSSTEASFLAILKNNAWLGAATLIGAFVVLVGYLYGIKIFHNIWLVTLTSWSAVVITETLLAWTVFHTIPHGWTLVGFTLVLCGFAAAQIS